MGKTDWEIKEELRRENPHFRKLWDIYAAMNERAAERKQEAECVLMTKVKDEMYQTICQYRKDNQEL